MSTKQGISAIPWLLLPLAASLTAHAQDTETRPLEGFDAVAIGGGIDLAIRQGERFRVEIEAEDGRLDEILTEVRGGTLEIRRRRSGLFDWDGVDATVDVTLPKLTSLVASGGSNARGEGSFVADELEIVASGGSDVTVDVEATTLELQASGGSDLRVSGRARSADARASGGSDLDASRLVVDEAAVESSGGSDLMIEVRERIAGNASGGSDVAYHGDPRVVDVETSGGSDVLRR